VSVNGNGNGYVSSRSRQRHDIGFSVSLGGRIVRGSPWLGWRRSENLRFSYIYNDTTAEVETQEIMKSVKSAHQAKSARDGRHRTDASHWISARTTIGPSRLPSPPRAKLLD
jgi:hypothetical protein